MANEVAKLIFKAETTDIDKAIKRLGYLSGAANDAEKEVGDLGKAAGKADDKVGGVGKQSNKASKGVKGLGKAAGTAKGKLVGMAAALVSVGTGLAFAGKFNEVNKQFAIMQGQLVTATGSAAAAADEFERLKEFAATTPFDLAQSVDGFVKLKNLGLDPSQESLRSFGNTAAAMGKDLNQMIEAVADASTGEFERLKEFGIKSKTEGDKVSFVFQGVTTTVGKNAEEITGYLAAIGNEKFGDAMSNQAASFAGATSNLQDSFDNLFREAGAGGALESMTESFRDLSTSLATPEAIKGAQAISDLMAAIVEGASTSLSGLLEFMGRLENMAGLKIGFDGAEIIPANSVEGVKILEQNITNLEKKLVEQEEDLQGFFNLWVSFTAKAKKFKDSMFLDYTKDVEESKEAIKSMNEKITETKLRLQEARQAFDDVTVSAETVSGSMSASMGFFDTGEAPQMSAVGGVQVDPLADVQTSADVAAEAAKAEKDRLKAIETEFAEWKKDQQGTELDRLKEGYLLQEEAYQEHMDEMLRIELEKQTIKKDLDDSSFLQSATGNKAHQKFLEKAKKGEIKLEELSGKQKLKIGVGFAGDILNSAAQSSEKAFKLQKGLKIAETIQSTYSSATGAYDALADIPYVGPALGIAAAAAAVSAGMANVNAIRSTTFNKGGGGGGGGRPAVPTSTGGGRVSASSMADATPLQLAANDEAVTGVPNIVNVTVDGSIDPTGARRIIEAINEATEDGLEINALVGT